MVTTPHLAPTALTRWFSSLRQVVETAFAHPCESFGLQNPGAHTRWGLMTQVAAFQQEVIRLHSLAIDPRDRYYGLYPRCDELLAQQQGLSSVALPATSPAEVVARGTPVIVHFGQLPSTISGVHCRDCY